jgi:putative addiction module component (TIGR02574 family)
MTELEVLEAEVLKLDAPDRMHLLEKLIASLDVDPDVEQAWEQLADQREAELDSGAVKAVPGEEVLKRLRSRLPR